MVPLLPNLENLPGLLFHVPARFAGRTDNAKTLEIRRQDSVLSRGQLFVSEPNSLNHEHIPGSGNFGRCSWGPVAKQETSGAVGSMSNA